MTKVKQVMLFIGVVMIATYGHGSELPVVDSGARTFVAKSGQHKGHRSEFQRDFKWEALRTVYRVHHRICTDKTAHPDAIECVPGDVASICLSEPTRWNWYGNGFIRVFINEKRLDYYIADFRISDRYVEATWNMPDAGVRLNFSVVQRDGDETRAKLKIRGEITSTKDISSIRIELHCFPNSFERTAGRINCIATQMRDMECPEGEKIKLNKTGESWVVYYDKSYTKGKSGKKFSGPCAFKYDPSQVDRVVVRQPSDPRRLTTSIIYPATTSAFELCFWEFKDLANSEAVEYMKNPAKFKNDAVLAKIKTLYLPQTDYFLEEKEALVIYKLAGDLDKITYMNIKVTNEKKKVLVTDKIKIDMANPRFKIGIKGLKEGSYKIVGSLVDEKGKIIRSSSKEALFRKMSRPFAKSLDGVPYVQCVTFYTKNFSEIDDSWIKAVNNSPYQGVAAKIIDGYDVNPVPGYQDLKEVIAKLKKNCNKDIWPWIFVNRTIGRVPDEGHSSHKSKPIEPYFADIKGMDLYDETGALSDFYGILSLALEIAKELKSPGILYDHESYNNYRVNSVRYLAEKIGKTEEEIINRLMDIGKETARIIREEYPGTCFWVLAVRLKGVSSIDYIIYGLLEEAKRKNIPVKVIEGGESSLKYVHKTEDLLKMDIEKRGLIYSDLLLEYPENFFMGGTISPTDTPDSRKKWIKERYAGSGISKVEDLLPFFEDIFATYKYVWIYAASAAGFNPFTPAGDRYHSVIKQATDNVTAGRVKVVFKKPPQTPSLTTKRLLGKPPVIDGVLDDTCWSSAVEIDKLFDYQTGAPAKFKTKALIAYDKDNLYLGITCYDPKAEEAKQKAKITAHDDKVWRDECVEVFINPYPMEEKYYHIVINPMATIYDAANIRGPHIKWESEAIVKTTCSKDSWVVEAAIPLSSFENLNNVWDFNLCRERHMKPQDLSCWSPTFGGFQNPSRFGKLIFDKSP